MEKIETMFSNKESLIKQKFSRDKVLTSRLLKEYSDERERDVDRDRDR